MAKKKKKKQLKKKMAHKKANSSTKKGGTKKSPTSKVSAKKGQSKKTKKPAKATKQVKKVEAPKPKPAPKPKHSKVSVAFYKARKPIMIGFTVLALFAFFQLSSLVLTFELLNKAAPGTNIAGFDISSLTQEEAFNKLAEKGQPYLETPIRIELEGVEAEFLPYELGIVLDANLTLNDVDFIKFDNSNFATIMYSAWNGKELPFSHTIGIEDAIANIEEKLNFDELKSKNAHLQLSQGTVAIVPERAGKAVDMKKLYKDIQVSASSLSNQPIKVETYDHTPLVTQAELEAQLAPLQEKLQKNITLNYENFNFNIKLIDHLHWITFEYKDVLNVGEIAAIGLSLTADNIIELDDPVDLDKELEIALLKGPFYAWVDEKMSPVLEATPEDVKIYTDIDGEVVIEGKGLNGQTISRENLLAAVNLAVNNGIDEVTIPVQIQEVNVDVSADLKELGIKELISTGKSAFAGSTGSRIHNINTGISKFQGYIIKPGETFSFTTILGPVEAYTGYRQELVIKPEGTIPEYGGGLCQVSSTMYRAALFAGLPIVERSPHSYAVSYYSQIYGWGLDATIYPGVHDVRFLNDTPAHILIQGYTDGLNAYFNFYGTSDGRSVELEGPYLGGYHYPGPTVYIETPTLAPGQQKWMESSHTGFNATWYRHLTDKEGETTKETISSAYRAIPARVLVGPGVVEAEGEVEGEVGGEESEA